MIDYFINTTWQHNDTKEIVIIKEIEQYERKEGGEYRYFDCVSFSKQGSIAHLNRVSFLSQYKRVFVS